MLLTPLEQFEQFYVFTFYPSESGLVSYILKLFSFFTNNVLWAGFDDASQITNNEAVWKASDFAEVVRPIVTSISIDIGSVIIVLFLFCLVFFVMTLLLDNKLIFSVYQNLYIKYFTTIEQIIRDLITNKIGKQYYYSFLMFLFIFINLCNLHSLIPYSYAITSSFAVTFTLSFIFFLTLNLTGILYHGIYLLNLFFPSGTPFIILPLLIIIEIISYFARMFSLAIRLFANITAGHILLKILSWFTYLLKNVFFVALVMSLVISALWVLEFFISILQAYVFLILLCIYVNEVLQLH